MATDSRVRRGLRLEPQQELHEQLMWAVLERVRDLDMVLKGGTALAFTRGLNRHSTDLDFDAGRPVELRDRIDSAARALGVNLEPARRQDWRDHQRFLARYPTPRRSEDEFFKVNVRYAKPLRAEDIEVIGGIRSYKVPSSSTKSWLPPRAESNLVICSISRLSCESTATACGMIRFERQTPSPRIWIG